MEASTYETNGSFAKELEDELMKFTTNYEENNVDMYLVDQTEDIPRNADLDVNITECSKSGGGELVEAECLDTTESSSSFDDCDYGLDDVDDIFGESEVLSGFRGDAASAVTCNGLGEKIRKKKPTTHWRSFIHPLMWRCKWVEMQIKKFEAQAQKYDRELEEYSQQKQFQLEESTVESLGVKSLPFPQNCARGEVFRRKKRRRAESTQDVAAYMSHHNLFSYYENRKHLPGGAFMVDELKNPAKATQKTNNADEFGGKDELLSVETKNADDSLENIFRKIEHLQSQVGKLKSIIHKVKSENAEKFSCTNNSGLRISCDASIGSPPNDGNRVAVGTYIASQLIAQCNMADVLVPESAVTRQGEVVPNTNGNTNRVYFSDAYGNGDDEVLIDNWRVKEGMNNFEEVKFQQPIQRSLVLKDGSSCSTAPAVPAEPDPPTDDQPSRKIRFISNLTPPETKTRKGRRRGRGR